MQKPFGVNMLVNIVEDKTYIVSRKKLDADIGVIKALKPTHEQVIDLLQRLRDIQKKHRTL